jgi:tRNA(Ile)-lysidine synthase
MRILRGSGLNGLRGIAPLREDGVVRPLLSVRKEELVSWLEQNGYAFRHDDSNSDLRFFRNRIRHTLIPQIEACWGGAVEHIAALATEAQTLWNERSPRVSGWLHRYLHRAAHSFIVDKKGLHDQNRASEGLRQFFTAIEVNLIRFHITSIINETNHIGGMVLLPDGWRCRVGRTHLYFDKRSPSIYKEIVIPGMVRCDEVGQEVVITPVSQVPDQLNQGRWLVYIDGATIDTSCIYRTVSSGDRFIPFGKKNEVTIWHFLKKQGLTLPEREYTCGLYTEDNKLVWIPGIRLDERFRITSGTKKVLKIQSKRFSQLYNVF